MGRKQKKNHPLGDMAWLNTKSSDQVYEKYMADGKEN